MSATIERRGTLEGIALGLASLLGPLESRLEDGRARALLAELGLRLPPAVDSVPAFRDNVKNIAAAVKTFGPIIEDLVAAIAAEDFIQIAAKAVELATKIAQTVDSFTQLANGIKTLAGPSGIPVADLNAFAANLPQKLLDYLLVTNLENLPYVVEALELAGIVSRKIQNAGSVDPAKPEYLERTFDLNKLTSFLKSPQTQLAQMYDWGAQNFNGSKLLPMLEHLLQMAHAPAILDTSVSPPVLDIMVGELKANTTLQPPGLEFLLVDKIAVDGNPTYAQDDWKIEAVIKNELNVNSRIVVQPNGQVMLVPPAPVASGEYSVRWTGGQENGDPYILLGMAGGPRIELRQLVLEAGAKLVWDAGANSASSDFTFGGEIKGGKVVIKLDGADGFLKTIASAIDLETAFDLGFGFSSQHGIYFHGSAALEIKLPVHVSLGPIEFSGLLLSLGIQGNKFPIGIAGDIKAALGPLNAVVEQIGIKAIIEVPDNKKGNLGPVDFSLGFQPPKGVGLSLDVGVVKGGGYLFFDFEKEEYAGALELAVMDIVTVKAIGLVTTRMPDGSKGFSLLIIVSAEFTGIQLGFGFTLNGLGGLLGLNRTMQLEVIATGVRTGGINSIMFPKDIIANAQRIISDLRTYFPPQEDRFLIGLMAKIGWGTPTLASLSFGLIVEIPPGKIAILGILKVALPAEDAPLIVIQVNFIGAIEPDKDRLWFFAELFESRVLFIAIEGGMGLLVAWGDDANFVLSVGGFHPRFNPPPLPFPVPKRVALDILNTPLSRIRVEGYFAVTSNTVQFGARVELRLGLDEIGIFGQVAFDALFQFSPFYFIIEISGSVELKVFGIGLFSIRLDFSLEGPTPWRAHGTGTLSLLFFDVSADFDITWGDKQDTTLPPIEVMPLLVGEFNKIENWRAELPKNNNLLVSLRALEETAGLVLHPVGALVISQRGVPLDLDIAKVGSQKVADAKRFSVNSNTTGLDKNGDRQEPFALGQFLDLANDEKLSRKAYEKKNSGLKLSVAGRQAVSSRAVKRIVRYEMIVIDSKYKKQLFQFFAFSATLFRHFLRGNAAARSPLSRATQKMFVPFDDKVAVRQQAYAVATNFDNKAVNGGKAFFDSESAAYDFMNAQTAANPNLGETLHVIPAHEVVNP
jgi:Family of unknown function (DUF6603)